MGRFLLWLLIACVVAAGGALGVAALWRAIGGGPLPIHGWIALTLGVTGTVALAWVLMALAFKSDREGWDDRADGRPDVDRDDPRP